MGSGAQAGRGLFITFEGGDGTGKSTQIQRVRQWFEERGQQVVVTREPGGTGLGTTLRQLVQNGPEDVDPAPKHCCMPLIAPTMSQP